MVPWAEWDWSMLRRWEPNEPYISREGAHYPTNMNKELAELWVRGWASEQLDRSQTQSMVRTGRWSNTLIAAHLHHGTPTQQPPQGVMLDTPLVGLGDE